MSSLAGLRPFLARYRTRLTIGFACAALGAATAALGPYVLGRAVDDVQRQGVVVRQTVVYGALLVLIALLDGLCKYGQRMLISGVSYRVERDMRQALFDRYMLQDQAFYGAHHTGDLMARATNDLSAVRQLLGPGLSSTLGATLTLLAASVFMFSTNLTLGLLVITLLPGVSVLFFVVGARMRRVFRHVQDQFGNLSTRAQENFSGIRTIKAYAQEQAEIQTFREANEVYRRLNLRYVLLSGLLWPAVTLLLGLVAALVLLVGGQLVATGQIGLGDLVQFNAYLVLLAWPMIALGWTVNLYQQAAASMLRLNEIYRSQPAIADPPVPTRRDIRGAVEFCGVGIRWRDWETADERIVDRGAPPTVSRSSNPAVPHNEQTADRESSATVSRSSSLTVPNTHWILREISFSIPAGTSLAIVGATGAGKTTLVNLLARVRDPDAGQVLIDGVDVRDLPLATLRAAIGYVPQETFLFSVPLRENVTFGRDDASDAEIDRAVTISRLSNDLVQFPDGLDTLVGERGVTLSGGQKQRTAIARAILRDPAILVLDDALSSVDTHTAAEILAGLRQVLAGRTSIVIAQRIATVKDCDQIIVLHDGAIVERGSHRELVAQGGRYAAMYRRELLQAELDEG